LAAFQRVWPTISTPSVSTTNGANGDPLRERQQAGIGDLQCVFSVFRQWIETSLAPPTDRFGSGVTGMLDADGFAILQLLER
jgi:hypothetical protein